CNSHTIRRGQAPCPEFCQSFRRVLNASYRSFIQFGVCWQLALFLPQPIDAQASKLEAEVGIEQEQPFQLPRFFIPAVKTGLSASSTTGPLRTNDNVRRHTLFIGDCCTASFLHCLLLCLLSYIV